MLQHLHMETYSLHHQDRSTSIRRYLTSICDQQLALHRHNLVVHESALPQGQGWSPVTWQILEGASRIPITLLEANADLDAGPIYLQQQIALKGHELVQEWRALQAQATLEICLAWFDRHQEMVAAAKPQPSASIRAKLSKPDVEGTSGWFVIRVNELRS
jgi:methionyl-tRNA formyltransferase